MTNLLKGIFMFHTKSMCIESNMCVDKPADNKQLLFHCFQCLHLQACPGASYSVHLAIAKQFDCNSTTMIPVG